MIKHLKNIAGSSIGGKALFKIALRVSLVITIITAIAYIHMINVIKDKSLENLEKYIVERIHRENEIFRLAEENHAVLKKELLDRLQSQDNSDPVNSFNQKLERLPDGTIRTRLEGFDGSREPFAFIGKQVDINADLRRRVIIFLELSKEYGSAWHHRLQNVYFTAPENLLAGYWPEMPDWAHVLPSDTFLPDEEFMWVADKDHNPTRESVWTGLFYDIGAKIWMASLETPVDIEGRHIATIGHDITLNELFNRTINDHLEGSYNLIIREDGRLIAHPDMMEAIKAQGGNFDVRHSGDLHLEKIYQALQDMQPDEIVLENKEYDEYLAVGLLKEPGWYLISVYPRSQITGPAIEAASVVLLLGLISLIIELIIFSLVLNRDVSGPLKKFSEAVKAVRNGDFDLSLDTGRNDEIGTLGNTFNQMTSALQQHDSQLCFRIDLSNAMAKALSSYVTDRDSVRNIFKNLLSDMLRISDSGYGFIGELQYDDSKPFIKTLAISYNVRDQESQYLGRKNDNDEMEFHNLDNLSGAVIRDKAVVVSNDPQNDPFSGGLPDGHPPINSFLGVPLVANDEPIGMVVIANRPQGYDQSLIDDIDPLFQTCSSVFNAYRKHMESKKMEKALVDSEKRFRQIADNAPIMIGMTDENGHITFLNKTWLDFRGKTMEEEEGWAWIAGLHPDDRERTLSEMESCISKLRPYSIEYRIEDRNGRYHWLLDTAVPRYDENMKSIGYVGTAVNITERKNAEIELQQYREHLEELVEQRTADIQEARNEAERANIAKSEFLSHMSHDLRTPMNAILGFGQMLELDAEGLTETQRDNVREIMEAGHHLLTLINDLLDLAKIESGNMAITMQKVNLDDLVKQCIKLIQSEAEERNVKIIDHISSQGYEVQADLTRLKQVLLNLLSNAVKYNKKNGHITLQGEIIDKKCLRIYITDTGMGLKEDDIDKLFMPFERLDKVNNVEGTGIGLIITKHLIELMGGTIGVESTSCVGSTFWVEISLFNEI